MITDMETFLINIKAILNMQLTFLKHTDTSNIQGKFNPIEKQTNKRKFI